MVLSTPPPDDEPREGRWLDAIQLELKLAGDRGILVLVDAARPERLRDILITLLPTFPEIDVYPDVRDVYQAPEGSVMILLPKAEDAEFLNVNRPVFEARRLKVVLWCDEATTQVLRRNAFDFYDWISHFHVCPFGAALRGVFGIREALCKKARVIHWHDGDLDACFRVALPGRRLARIAANRSFAEIVSFIRSNRASWILIDDFTDWRTDIIDLAIRESGRRGRLVVTGGPMTSQHWLQTAGNSVAVGDHESLSLSGAERPARLAALTGYEPGAFALAGKLLAEGMDQTTIEHALRRSEEPRSALARLAGEQPKAYAYSIPFEGPTVGNPQGWAVDAAAYAFELSETGDLPLAEAAARRAVELTEATYGPTSRWHACALQALGRAYVRRGSLLTAEENFRRAYAVLEEPAEQVDVLFDLTDVLTRQGRYPEAETSAAHAVESALDTQRQEKAKAALAHVRELRARSEGRGTGSDPFRE